MPLAFDQPAWLLLVLAVVPFAYTGMKWFVSMSRVRRVSAVVVRSVLIAVVAAMLAGASSVRETRWLAVVGVVDLSGSVQRFADLGVDELGRPMTAAEAARSYFARATADRGPDDLFGLVVFDGRSIAIATPSRADVLERPLVPIGVEGTDIASALRYAAALIGPDAAGRIVLMSDGNETTGDAVGAAAELASRSRSFDAESGGLPIDVAPWSYRVGAEVIVERIDTPPRSAAESTITVRVLLRATAATTGTLYLTREGEPINIGSPGPGRRVRLEAGVNVERIAVELGKTRLHRFRAVFEPDLDSSGAAIGDQSLDNNSAEAFTITPGRGSVLLVDGVSDAAPGGAGMVLAAALEASGIDVRAVSPAGMPRDLLELDAYDLVILQNVPAEAIDRSAHEQLASYVRDLGGGLVMIGGPDSFGAGGWNDTAIEDILPVTLDLPQRLVSPEAAIVFVLDRSGSMGGSVLGSARSQQQIANEAAALAVASLDKADLVGVVSFSNTPRIVVPIGPNADPGRTQSAIRSISSGGGTNLGPALQTARRELAGVDAKVKHVIVLSDGQSIDAASLPAIAQAMLADGIRVSTIAVGDGADLTTMSAIAGRGGGVFYNVVNPNILPKVFLKAVRIVRSPLIREQPFEVVVPASGSPLTAGMTTPPTLHGLVLTQARRDVLVTNAMLTPTGEPVLAHWPVELGQVAAFTSDAHGWARDWLGWDGYQQFWSRLVRSISRAPADGVGELSTTVENGRLHLRLEAAGDDGRPLDQLTVAATVYSPSGQAVAVALTQTGPGVYEASTPATETGNYIALVSPSLGSQRLSPVLGGGSVAAGVEYQRLRSNIGLLRRIAQAGGGRLLDFDDPESAALFDRTGVPVQLSSTPLWPVLLGWSVFFMLLDVGTRRVAWDRYFSREFGSEFSKMAADSVRDRSQQASAAASRLKGTRSKPRSRPTAAPTLGALDAAAVAVEQRRQRHAARQEDLAKIRAQMKADAPKPEPTPTQPDDATEDDAPSGLLAAKRRASKRFETPSDDPPE